MPRKRYGLSLLEIMLGLSIGALMFAAVAGAIQVGARSTTVNQNFFSATQAGRVGMAYMLRTIRQSDPEVLEAAPDDEPTTVVQLAGANGDEAHEFTWDQEKGLLIAKRIRVGEEPLDPDPVLARNVTSFQCRRQATEGPDGWVVTNYQINMTITVGQQSISYSESVIPRRAEFLR